MDFYAILDQVIALLKQRGRASYRALKVQFHLDDEALEVLKAELLYAQPQVIDDAGRGLVWTGGTDTAPSGTSAPVETPGPAPLAYTPPYLVEKILTSKSALEGERKQVTVLFADLKDSTELIRGLDPEAAQQLLDPALHRMMDAVHRYEGTVNQVLGDGIMALFGAPIAHEDHAVRACYAALAMQGAIRTYAEEVRRTHGVTVQIRVGLNSGEVVVRAIGNDLHMDYTAVGQTTHLAARMEQLAQPGSTLLTAETLRLVEGLVRVTALGPIPVKGLDAPVEVFELVSASALRGRFPARVAGGLTRFVGRDTELAALHQLLERAGAGHGQIVAAVGEAGVGKSRLAIARALPPAPGAAVEWREGDALALPFAEAVFNLVCCQQGVQFFPDKPAALREMHRVLVPGGRLVLNIWRAIEYNPVALAMAQALGRHVSPEAEAYRHRPFALGDAEALRALVVGAGFGEVMIRPVVKVLRFPSAEAFVQRYIASVAPLAQMVAQADDQAPTALLREVSAAVQAYVDADGFAMPKASHLVTARR